MGATAQAARLGGFLAGSVVYFTLLPDKKTREEPSGKRQGSDPSAFFGLPWARFIYALFFWLAVKYARPKGRKKIVGRSPGAKK